MLPGGFQIARELKGILRTFHSQRACTGQASATDRGARLAAGEAL